MSDQKNWVCAEELEQAPDGVYRARNYNVVEKRDGHFYLISPRISVSINQVLKYGGLVEVLSISSETNYHLVVCVETLREISNFEDGEKEVTVKQKFASAAAREVKLDDLSEEINGYHSKDLIAFKIMLLFVKAGSELIGSAEKDTIYFSLGQDELVGITQKEVDILTACGVFYHEEYDCLMMFV